MGRKAVKNSRERLCTQEFFALPADEDETCQGHSTSSSVPSNPRLSAFTESTAKGSGHCKDEEVRPANLDSQARSERQYKAAVAIYQTEVNRAQANRSERDKLKKELEVLDRFDWQDEVTRSLVGVWEIYGKSTSTAEEKLAARCNRVLFGLDYRKEELDVMLCHLQVFNVEKTRNDVADLYLEIRRQEAARHGFKFKTKASREEYDKVKRARKPDGKENETHRQRKRLAFDPALAAFEQQWVVTAHNVTVVCQEVNDEPVKLPTSPPDDLTFNHVELPEGLPQDIRRAIEDVEFIFVEILHLREEIIELRDKVRNTLMIWSSCKDESWANGKKQAHSLPQMITYERTRSWLLTCYVLQRCEEDKIRRYAKENKLEGVFSPKLCAALGLGPHEGDLPEDAWDTTVANWKIRAPSLDEMLEQCEEVRASVISGAESHATIRHGDWWKALKSKG